jgi:hypothetical protein
MNLSTYDKRKMFREMIVLIVTSQASFLIAYTISALNVALPPIGGRV